jgi:oligogalacturonide transport system permease protein
MALAFFMIYPLIWMFFSAFKSNMEIFSSASLFPVESTGFSAFRDGWKGNGRYTYTTFFLNTFRLVIPTVLFTMVSSTLTGYGFARFIFPGKKVLFSLVIGTLLLPHEVLIVPRYIMFNNFNWLNTYKPFAVPALLGTYSFFIFMMVQFVRGIPKDLDEAAYIDGCGSLGIFLRVILPLLKPALFSIAIFQFVWRWNDFFNALLFIHSVSKYPVSLALRMAIDAGENANWNRNMAMSLVCMLPPIIVYLIAQRYFVEGITSGGIKG